MLKAMFAVALIGTVGAFDVNYHTKAFNVTAAAPIVVTNLSQGGGFVVGADGLARTCPDVKGMGVFVRGEWKGAANIFQNVSRSAMIVSDPDRKYTIACLKVE